MSSNEKSEYDFAGLKNDEMKEVLFENKIILVVKHQDQIFALSNKCTHYGAPLIDGILRNGIIRCPWHGACFNVQTGDIEEFPGLDSLTSFTVENICEAKFKIFKTNKVFKGAKIGHNEAIVILGGGPCGLECAEMLRKKNFCGKIIIISKDSHLTYDRPKLSKVLPIDFESIVLRRQEFYALHNIDFILGRSVDHIDFVNKSLMLSDSSTFQYDKLMLAMGATPFIPPIPGIGLKNILTLRTYNDAQDISANLNMNTSVVVIGGSFIGMILTSSIASKVKSIIVVDRNNVPFEHTFGPEVGTMIKAMHLKRGVQFEFNSEVVEFQGDLTGKVQKVFLSTGKTLVCDCCILGVGVKPDTQFLSNQNMDSTQNLKIGIDAKTGFIEVDECMATNIPDVYAGGDMVKFPLFLAEESMVNIQHWQMALKHGKIAAQNMISLRKIPIRSVPYYWTLQYGQSFCYVGFNHGYQEILIHNNADMSKYVVYYLKDNIVKAALAFMSDPVASIIADILLSGKQFTKTEVGALQPSFNHFNEYVQALKDLLASCPLPPSPNKNKYRLEGFK